MLDLIGPRVAPDFATKLLETAGRTHHGEFGGKLAGSIAGFTPACAAGIRVLLSKTDWMPALLTALDDNKIALADLSADQKQALVSSSNRESLPSAQYLQRGGACPAPIGKRLSTNSCR